MDLPGFTRSPSPESVAAELQQVICPVGLVPGKLAERAGELVELGRLGCVQTRTQGPEPIDFTRTIVILVKAAVARLEAGPSRETAELLLGLGRTRGLLRKDRRRIAADALDISREHFRKHRELPLLLELAEELCAIEVEYVQSEQARSLAAAAAMAALELTKAQLGPVGSTGRSIAAQPMLDGDDCRFVADVTVPDGTTVRVGQRFIKTWEIRNCGSVEWSNRYLQRKGPSDVDGLCRSPARVPIPHTLPGEPVRISVPFTAPGLPGSCRADWMIVDETGRYYFPNKHSLYIIVNIAD
jgi:hypothetical protein